MGLIDLLPQILPVVSTVAASGFGLTYWLDRRKRKAEEDKTRAEGKLADADGQVAISGTALLWAQRADSAAEKANMRAELAEKNVLANLRKIDEQQDQINDLERSLEQCQMRLVEFGEHLNKCAGGLPCPLQTLPFSNAPWGNE